MGGRAPPGASASIVRLPAGRSATVHNFRNTAGTPSRILVGFTPSGMEGFFRESGRPASDDGPAPPLDEDEIARTVQAGPKYGVEAVAFD
jgi:hypothetical protein